MLLVAAPWYLLAELKTPGFLEYFLLGEHWQRFVTAGWDGDRYGNAHAYPYGSVWLFLLAAAFPWSLWLPLLLWLAGASAGGGRWRRLAQALLAVLGTGAVPVLHLRRQRPLDLRAARPAGPGVARRRPAARAAGAQRLAAAWWVGLPGTDPIAVRAVPRLPAAGPRAPSRSPPPRCWPATPAGASGRWCSGRSRPYSAVFYSGGRAQRAEDSELAGWLRRDALLAIRSRSFGALPDEVRQRLRCRPPVGQYQLCQAWRRLAETTSAGRRSSRDAGRCAGGCGRCPGGGHRCCTGGSCGRGTGSRRWPCG